LSPSRYTALHYLALVARAGWWVVFPPLGVSSPSTKGGGGGVPTLAGRGGGWGVNILEDARNIGLASYSIISLRVGVCRSTELKPWAWDPPNLRMLRHKGPDQSIYSPTIRDRHAPENPVDRVTDDLDFHLFGENQIVTVFTKSVKNKAFTNTVHCLQLVAFVLGSKQKI
jgi:hypothetical protein